MVGGKQVLLSLAVLLGGGLEGVLGAQPRRRNETIYDLGHSSSSDSPPSIASAAANLPSTPPTVPSMSVTTTVVGSVDFNVSTTTSAGQFDAPQPGTPATPIATSSWAVPPQIIPPAKLTLLSRPTPVEAVSSISVDLGPVVAATSIAPTSWPSSIDLKATVDAQKPSSTSSTADYMYPAAYGVGGALTTDVNAPTRSVMPTRNSVMPNSGAVVGPPPMDDTPLSSTMVTTARVPPMFPPPALPTPAEASNSDIDFTFGSGGDATSPSPAVAIPTTPRGPAAIPPTRLTTIVIVESSDSVSLGNGALSTSTTAPPSTITSTSRGVEYSASGWNSTTLQTSTLSSNQTQSIIYSNHTWTRTAAVDPSSTGTRVSSISYCQASDYTAAVVLTSWSVVYTSTITWYGIPSDYTAPFPTITTPTVSTLEPCVDPSSPPRYTVSSVCSSTGTNSRYVTCSLTTSTDYGYGVQTSSPRPSSTVVFVTTDKNPAVVYSPISTPNYGVSQAPSSMEDHASATRANLISTPVYNSVQTSASQTIASHVQQHASPNPITVVVQPTAVVINGNTITDNPAAATQVVVIGGETFTINPTQVIGAGATVDRPQVTGGAVYVPSAPITTSVGGLPVVVSSSLVVVGGTSFTLGPTPTTAVVNGQTVSIGPGGIAVGPSQAASINPGGIAVAPSQTLLLPTATVPMPTEVVVAGGSLVTAIGKSVVVIQGTTITYGTSPSSPATTTVVGGDTITLGPSGIVVHGSTLGGASARATDTQFALVGGATMTEIGASVLVVGGTSYTVGPGATGTTTATVGDATITIGPSGVVVMSTLSFAYPFGPTTTIIPHGGSDRGGGGSSSGSGSGEGGGSQTMMGASATITPFASSSSPSKDGAGELRPPGRWGVAGLVLCIAIGVMGFGV